jgi:hypothetical protein
VTPEKDGDSDDEFNMTARHTRFGFDYFAPESWGPKAMGKLEIDFYGDGKENAPGVRLRHAYLLLDFGEGWTLLAGQTCDVFSPLWQYKLNTAVGWHQGNTGFRRPLLRIGKDVELSEGAALDIDFAIARPMAEDLDGYGGDDGEDAGIPDLQARVGSSIEIIPDAGPCAFGLGGFMGWREADLGDEDDYDAYAIVFDLIFPITKEIKIFAELFTGQAMGSYRGGLNNDYNSTLGKEVQTTGGFLNLHWKPDKKWFVVVGAGVDDPKDSRLESGKRSKNTSYFGNVRYKITKQVWVGFEYDRMSTKYKDEDTANNNRFQVTFLLKF